MSEGALALYLMGAAGGGKRPAGGKGRMMKAIRLLFKILLYSAVFLGFSCGIILLLAKVTFLTDAYWEMAQDRNKTAILAILGVWNLVLTAAAVYLWRRNPKIVHKHTVGHQAHPE